MPLYDYGCKECGVEFNEMARIDDRFVLCEQPCSECGGEITLLIGAPALVDSMTVGVSRPPDSYHEVVSKINEKAKLNDTRYQVHADLSERNKNMEKKVNPYIVKKQVHDNMIAKKGRGKKKTKTTE